MMQVSTLFVNHRARLNYSFKNSEANLCDIYSLYYGKDSSDRVAKNCQRISEDFSKSTRVTGNNSFLLRHN